LPVHYGPARHDGTGKSACPTCLTWDARLANINDMAYSFLVFNFGGNEEAAQQARHRIDGWRQGFRLDKKLQLKFDRKDKGVESNTASSESYEVDAKGKAKSKAKPKSEKEITEGNGSSSATTSDIHMIVRLDFSDHEKLSHHRWLERIPGEEPFKAASPKVLRPGDAEFEKTSELFDSLD
jgi:hypothetical protein